MFFACFSLFYQIAKRPEVCKRTGNVIESSINIIKITSDKSKLARVDKIRKE